MKFASLFLLASLGLLAQLPDGPGRDEVMKRCTGCHELGRSVSPRLDRDGWSANIAKMIAFGMRPTEQEHTLILDYLAKHFPADPVPKVQLNSARAVELEAGLTLRRSQAAMLVAWREKNGPLKSFEDLKKIPGFDAAMLEAKKDRIAF
jgi:competence protein ComEA